MQGSKTERASLTKQPLAEVAAIHSTPLANGEQMSQNDKPIKPLNPLVRTYIPGLPTTSPPGDPAPTRPDSQEPRPRPAPEPVEDD